MEPSVRDMIYYDVTDHKMVRGEGVYLYDDAGEAYLDCASATFNLSLGYSHPAVVGAVQKQAELAIHLTSSFRSEPVDDLVRRCAGDPRSSRVVAGEDLVRFAGDARPVTDAQARPSPEPPAGVFNR